MTKAKILHVLEHAAVAAAAVVLTYLVGAVPGLDLGAATPAVVGVLSVGLQLANKWLQANPE